MIQYRDELTGTPHVLLDGEYGRICDDGTLGDDVAKVICREMGFGHGEMVRDEPEPGRL
jgi:hypothetical protein